MAKANSYTLRDGLGLLQAIIATDGKVMPRGGRQACRKIIAGLRAQSPAEVVPMSEAKRQWLTGIAELHFEQIHRGVAKRRAGRSVPKSVRV